MTSDPVPASGPPEDPTDVSAPDPEATRAPGAPNRAPPPAEEAEDAFDWRRYLATLRRYRWMVVAAALLGVVGAALTWRYLDPTYTAQGSLWVHTQSDTEARRGPITSGQLLDASGWVDLIHSYTVLDTVVVRQKLYVDGVDAEDRPLFSSFGLADQFAPGRYRLVVSEDGETMRLLRDGIEVERAPVGEPIGESVGFQWSVDGSELSGGEEIEFGVTSPRSAARRLRDELNVRTDQRGTFIRVELTGTDPERVSRIVNAVMDRHVSVAARMKRRNLDERTRVLRRQLDTVETELRTAERELESFRVETITLPSDRSAAIEPGLEMTRDPVFSNFFDLRLELEQVRRDRQRLEEIHQSLPDTAVPVQALELVPAVQSSSQLSQALSELVSARAERRTLLEEYTPEHESVQEVRSRIQTLENETVPDLVAELVEDLRTRETRLDERISDVSGDLTRIPPRSIEEARLRRRVTLADQLYNDLRSRYEEARLAAASSIPDVRILDRARPPESPAVDRRLRLALIVFFATVGVGVGGTLAADRFDSRIRYPGDVDAEIGLPILGAIPQIADPGSTDDGRNAAQVVEAFRDLRLNLDYAYGDAGPVVVTVSSPGKGEGKSLLAANLAATYAEIGKTTLLLDGDTRRGNVHELLGTRRKPGLVDLLAGKTDSSKLVQRTSYENLHFLGSGTRMQNSPELLASSRLSELFGALRERYDVVLVDSPPLGAGSDALVLSALTGHLLLVLRSGDTDKKLTRTKLEPLSRLPVRLLGAVLNDFRPESGPYQYYSSYMPEYATVSEDGEPGEEGSEPDVSRLLESAARES